MYNIQDPLIKQLDIKIHKLVTSNFLGSYKTAFKGQGIEFKDIRPYDHNDPYKNIDRLTTAKKGELHIRQYEEERQLTITFGLDVGGSMLFQSGSKSKLQTLAEIWYLLSSTALQNGDKIATMLFADQVLERHRPSRRKDKLYTISKELLHISGSTEFQSNINVLLEELMHLRVKHGLVVIISDDVDPDTKKLRTLSANNDLLYLYISDHFEDTAQISHTVRLGKKKVSLNRQSRELFAQRRQEQIQTLKKTLQTAGADMLHINDRSDIAKELLGYFMHK